LAPARTTRAISSSTKRSAPRALLALPVRARMCSTSPVSARVARIDHRDHAVVEQVIADLKDQALAHFASGHFHANGA
jgi:hypothetical protein